MVRGARRYGRDNCNEGLRIACYPGDLAYRGSSLCGVQGWVSSEAELLDIPGLVVENLVWVLVSPASCFCGRQQFPRLRREVLWLISLMQRIAASAVVEKHLYVRFVRIMLELL